MDVANDVASLSAVLASELELLCSGIEVCLDSDEANTLEVSIHLESIQEALEQLRYMADVLPPQDHDHAVRRLVALRGRLELLERNLSAHPQPQSWYRGERNALTLPLDYDLLVELFELRFTDEEIAIFLNCSRRTVQRRRDDLSLSKREQADLSHEDLCQLVLDVRNKGTGQEGERAIKGAVRAQRINISRARLRLAVRETDPFRHLAARRRPIERRIYSVPFVNSLWHLDGHHKLIRWKIVIHAAIDGKSRTVTFIKASSNNLASTVGDAFLGATEQWGWPSRVRADHGGENLIVKQYMEEKRGLGRGSFIQGSSVHNQRIERLWVDLQRWTTAKYRAFFEKLEDEEYMDANSPVHLWTLHFVFLPQLNSALQHFQEVWNHHPIRTPGLRNKSPQQLFAQGILEAKKAGWAILEGDAEVVGLGVLLRNFADYGAGVDDQGLRHEQRQHVPHVHIAALSDAIPPILQNETVQEELRQRLDSIWPPPEDMGIAVFQKALLLVNLLLQSHFNT
ncbi:unnamed protein product [Tilletia laevis]|uniref:Integrase catalytic domain-containing protein n=2 Tax=Tilletia TaxID=13289 RepID=A0A177U409_9BASI|nr:hypothetical protein CF335_g5608 [Tilletia laevis]KAE8254809.1 hypothetical protein A4X03_0g5664 [Tilletia caries]CAD6902099.1 unnamed protein product [Tilletia laevis]CAD6961190.1 unnamed protein product [Tilletia caries]CAD6971528.1 unnamed protein product [Tilletia controversa]